MKSYNIPECNMEKLQSKLKRIENKCKKYGVQFKFDIVGQHFKLNGDTKEQVKYYEVEVEGEAKVNDWCFVATIEHKSNGNIVRAYSEAEVPDWAYTVEPKCDHCKTSHYRKDTYLVRNELTGEFKQVGRSCLADFTRGLSAEHAACLMQFMAEVDRATSFDSLGSYIRYYDVREYLDYVAETIKQFGYTSKTKAYEMEVEPTAQKAADFMLRPNACKYGDYEKVIAGVKSGINAKQIDEALSWAKGLSDDEFGYLHNLKVACSCECCEPRDFGIIASLFTAYRRATEKAEAEQRAKAQKAVSEFVGEVGQRIQFTANCKCIARWSNDFGMCYIYKFVDATGNVMVWKTGKAIEDGEVTLKGTIKAHSIYDGEKQTELTRCKVI